MKNHFADAVIIYVRFDISESSLFDVEPNCAFQLLKCDERVSWKKGVLEHH